ncbi:MAG: hypothetical protein AAF735_01315 [Myxococcota bacterium]
MTELLGEGGPPADAFVKRAEQAVDRWFESIRRFAAAERSFSPDVALDGFPAEALIAKHICSAATRTYRYQYLKPAPSTDAANPAFVITGAIWFPGYGNEREFTVALRVPGLPN